MCSAWFPVACEDSTGGKVTPSACTEMDVNGTEVELWKYGDPVTLTVEPEDDYTVDTVTVNGEAITPDANGVYIFAMPNEAATVTAIFALIPAQAPIINAQPEGAALTYGYQDGGSVSVSASAAEGHALSYQ